MIVRRSYDIGSTLSLSESWRKITVEPAVFFYFVTFVLLELVNTNLYLQKACRNNATAEPDLSTPCDDEKRGISFVAYANTNFQFFTVSLMLIYSIVAANWSDNAGRRRRPLLLLPIVGQILQTVSNGLNAYFWHWPPLVAILSDIVLKVLFGGHLLMLLGAQIHLCDVTGLKDRTMRLGIFSALKIICLPIGNGVAGFLMHGIGFLYSYAVCFALTVVSLLLTVFLVRDASEPPAEHGNAFLDSISLRQVAEGFRIVFRGQKGRKRVAVVLLLVIHVAVWFASEGEKSVFYLYIRYRFGWDEKMYSLYLTYKFIGLIIGTLFCSLILSNCFNVHDGLIGSFAGFWDMLTVIGYLFANQNWHLYLIPILDIFHGVAISVCDSFLSKFFQSQEFGRLNSVLNIFTLIIPLCHPAYNITFQKTMDTFPSAFFLISIANDMLIFVLYGVTYHLCKNIDD